LATTYLPQLVKVIDGPTGRWPASFNLGLHLHGVLLWPLHAFVARRAASPMLAV